MYLWFTNRRLHVKIVLHILILLFKLYSPYIFKIHAVRPRRRRFIKENRYPVLFPDFISYASRERNTIFDRRPVAGNFGFRSGSVGRSYTNARLLGLPGGAGAPWT